MRIFNSRVG